MKLLTAVLLVLVAAPLCAEDDAKKALESFQGEWKIVEFIKEGLPDKPEELKDAKVVVDGSKMTITRRPGRKEQTTITLDSKATPMAIDIKPDAKDEAKFLIKGIYKLEKDKLTICYALEGRDRPKEFKAEDETNQAIFVLERVKK
jgi:uncharacterized protein (TIGR03067 family)